MEDRVDYDMSCVNLKVNGIRETPNKRTTVSLMNCRIDLEMSFQRQDCRIQTSEEFHSQTKGFFLVPRKRIQNILSGFGQKHQFLRHWPPIWIS